MAVPYSETLTLYKPTQSIAADLSVIPTAVALVGTITGNIHRGTEKSRSTVNNLGIFNVIPGYLFTNIANRAIVGDRYIIADEFGEYWVIHGRPAVRQRFPATSHIRAVVTLLRVKPVGIP